MSYCVVCRSRPCYPGSLYCSNTCRFAKQPEPATQGQPICRICDRPAYHDGYNYSPGCGKTHALQALSMGYKTPRF